MQSNNEKEKNALDYYKEQWIYRNKHYWNLLVKDVYLVLTIILFPNITDKIELLPKTKIPLWLFPWTGIVVSILFTYLLLAEAERMLKQGDVISKILTKMNYVPEKVSKFYRAPLSKCIPYAILVFHIIVACTYLFPLE